MRPVLVFDVNETLLDLRGVDDTFRALFGDASVRGEWFRQVLQTAMTVTLTGHYRDFSEIGASALRMVGRRRNVAIDDDAIAAVGARMRALPPHPEVPGALARLRDGGFRLVALTNSAPAAMAAQLDHAGIADLFSDRLSVESARALKPALAVYRTAAGQIGVPTSEMMMIAAHGWDLAGAMSAGCRTAFVARPGQVIEDLFPAPEIVGDDLGAVADQLLTR